MDFKAFDKSKLDEYSRQAKELYGNTPEYKEMQEKAKDRTEEEDRLLADRFMLLFKEAGEMKDKDPSSPEAQDLVKRIQDYITKNMYTCSDKILSGLGKMYSGGGEFTRNIDEYVQTVVCEDFIEACATQAGLLVGMPAEAMKQLLKKEDIMTIKENLEKV